MRNRLLPFLYRHPWAEQRLVEVAFGAPLPAMLAGADQRVRKVELPGVGICLVTARTLPGDLASFWRWRMVRDFALETLGARAVRSGLSPGPGADGEFPAEGTWWRIWADLGGVAPEALYPICHPPAARGSGVQDVLLTVSAERVPLLVAQVERAWSGEGAVSVRAVGSGISQSAYLGRRARQVWQGYAFEELRTYLREREIPCLPLTRRAAQREARMEQQASALSLADWDTLVSLGNAPLLTGRELSLLFAPATPERLASLLQLGLIEQRKREGEERLLLSWQGLHLLARFWGCGLADLLRRQPWPLKMGGRGHLCYAVGWAGRLGEHTRLTRQFVLSLRSSARLLSGGAQRIGVELETLIGARFFYAEAGERPAALRWVAPDALLRVRFQRDGTGDPARCFTVLVEIDRATNALPRLEARLDHYARLWGGLAGIAQPCLVWVIVGPERREQAILAAMRARRLPGWTVTLDRLQPEGGTGRGAQLAAGSLGGMAPFRPVWRSAANGDAGPFLGMALAGQGKGAKHDRS